MTATAIAEPPPLQPDLSRTATACQPLVLAGELLGHELLVHADRSLPFPAIARLLAVLNEEWDVRRRSSDIGRINNHPNVMLAVAPLTTLLVRNVLASVHLARRAGLDPGPCVALLDVRHSRAGLDPLAAAVAARLAPATAADVIADFCLGSGATVGHVDVGTAVRVLGSADPAWLHRAVDDVRRATGS